MAVTTTVNFNLLFEDDTTKTLSLGPLDPDNAEETLASLKNKIIAFENDFNSDTANLMISKYGNEWAGFESVKIVTTDKTVIF